MSNVSIIIPARWDSTRFPGKPLAKINDKEMILHVADGCRLAFGKNSVYVATDDERISDCVTKAGYKVIMTKKDQVFETGTDRVAYAAKFLDSEYIINVQGDEPLVNSDDIEKVYHKLVQHCEYPFGYGYCSINCYKECSGIDKKNTNTIKMVIDEMSELVYASRQAIPTFGKKFKKQVCIYGFKRDLLVKTFGVGKNKSDIEKTEDIEILRFMGESPVLMVEVQGKYQSVDVPEDIQKVERI